MCGSADNRFTIMQWLYFVYFLGSVLGRTAVSLRQFHRIGALTAGSGIAWLVLMSRVFVWGMPGNGHSEPGHETHLDDLNATKHKFVSGFGWQHMNTCAVNEALVLHYARAPEAAGKIVVGCNPGLIAHSGGGLRDKVHGGGFFGGIAEGLLSLFFQSAQSYADKMVAVMLAPELASGALLGPNATPILPARIFADDAAKASTVVADAAALLDQALAGKLAQ